MFHFARARSNISPSLFLEAATAALEILTVPSRTMEPSNLAAWSVAARRNPCFSTLTVHRQYSFVIMPTRNVKNALADPERMELASRCMPGIAATVDPKTVPRSTSTSTSSMPAAMNAVDATLA